MNQKATYTIRNKQVQIYAISTGSISVKRNFIERKGVGYLSKVNILLGHEYTEYLPIWVWVIDHPEGIIVVDTGEIEASAHADFYAKESLGQKFNLYAMKNKRRISREDELDLQLNRLGIQVSQVSKVILTHLHGDHTDGLKFFPNQEIIVHEPEARHPYGNLPTTYPKWFNPTLVNMGHDRLDVFGSGFPVTRSEDLWLVPTPGHTHHHCSVLLKTDQEHILLAGDVSYTQDQLLRGSFAGSNIDYVMSEATYKNIKDYGSKYPTIYLPSHDPASGERLAGKMTLPV